jgi:pimeloyl-ACP methyl ester carboxylesterase
MGRGIAVKTALLSHDNHIPRITIPMYALPVAIWEGAGMLTGLQYLTQFKRLAGILLLRGVPFWQRSRCRRIARWIVVAGNLYVAVFFALILLENFFLFPAAIVARPWCEPPEYLHVRELDLISAAGDHICAWFSAPADWTSDQGAVLYSHGNGSNLSRLTGRAFRWRELFSRAVLIYDYPGFGKSTGRPSEDGCYSAGDAAFRWLTEEQGVPVREIVLIGESMGGAIAVDLATRYSVRLMVLEGAFTSVPDMAQHRFPIWPSRYVARNRMDNEAKIGLAQCPTLIEHGRDDDVVPFQQGKRLFSAAHEPKLFVPMEGHGHPPPNDQRFYEIAKQFFVRTAR